MEYQDDNESQMSGDTVDAVVEALVIIGIVLLVLGVLAWLP